MNEDLFIREIMPIAIGFGFLLGAIAVALIVLMIGSIEKKRALFHSWLCDECKKKHNVYNEFTV